MKQQDALARVENNCPHDVALDDVHGRKYRNPSGLSARLLIVPYGTKTRPSDWSKSHRMGRRARAARDDEVVCEVASTDAETSLRRADRLLSGTECAGAVPLVVKSTPEVVIAYHWCPGIRGRDGGLTNRSM
jgi:hypothetical protein